MAESSQPSQHPALEYRTPPPRAIRPLLPVLVPQCLAWGAFSTCVLIVCTVLAPRFEAVFKDFAVALPTTTILILAISRWVRLEFGWLAIVLLPPAVAMVVRAFARYELPHGKRVFAELLSLLLAMLLTAFFLVLVLLGLIMPLVDLLQPVAPPPP